MVISILVNARIGFSQTFNWIIETVDLDDGNATSIKVDSNDYPHISYYDNNNFNLKYAKWNGSSWNIEVADGADDVGQYSSLAFGYDEYPCIAHRDRANNNLKFAQNRRIWDILFRLSMD